MCNIKYISLKAGSMSFWFLLIREVFWWLTWLVLLIVRCPYGPRGPPEQKRIIDVSILNDKALSVISYIWKLKVFSFRKWPAAALIGQVCHRERCYPVGQAMNHFLVLYPRDLWTLQYDHESSWILKSNTSYLELCWGWRQVVFVVNENLFTSPYLKFTLV